MNDLEKIDDTLLPEKEDFYSHLNMKDITDANYKHAKRVCGDLEIKKIGEYHDLYVQSDSLLLAYVFNNFQNICLEMYGLDSAHFISAPGLSWHYLDYLGLS